jgi:hypothetical protein
VAGCCECGDEPSFLAPLSLLVMCTATFFAGTQNSLEGTKMPADMRLVFTTLHCY